VKGVPLLEVRGLVTTFATDEGVARAVDGLDLSLEAGETLGLVGESGCGKSVAALSVLRLVAEPPGRIEQGRVLLRGEDLFAAGAARLAEVRGGEIAMVFQEPMTALNPVFTIENQVVEAIRAHTRLSRGAARARALELLAEVGIPDPDECARRYPHHLSGGMRQRVMIAMAVSCNPRVLIADEPTTALDVTIQAQILELLARLQREQGLAVLLITHDLGVVAEAAQRVAVMYAGKLVETAPARALFERPRHPYTIGLLRSLPELARPGERLPTIPGSVPSAARYPGGCRFRTRCPLASARCAAAEPPLEPVDGAAEHRAACFHLEEALGL